MPLPEPTNLPPPPEPSFRTRARAAALPSWAALKAIADAQRQIMLAVLAGILAVLFTQLPSPLSGEAQGFREVAAIVIVAVVVGVRLWMAVATYRLAGALGSKVAVLWAIGGFLPNLIGLIVLVVLSSRASSRLKKAGIKVGLLGAKLGDSPPPGFLCEELARDFA